MKKLLRSLFKKREIVIDLDEVIRKCNDKEALITLKFIIENRIKLLKYKESKEINNRDDTFRICN